MTKQFDTLPTGLPDFNGAPIDDFDLPDYMFSDPIHYSKEWFDFIENSVADDSIAQEYKQLITNIMQKQHGGDVRLSLAIFVYIIAHGFTVTLAEFDKISKEIRSRVESLEGKYKDLIEEWKNTLNGVTVDSELINARIELHGIVYKTLKERLDDMQSKIEDLNPTEKVFTLTHNQREHVSIRVVTGVNGLGIVPLSAPLGGLDVKEIPATATYESLNTVTVLVPLQYKMSNPKITRVASNQYLLAEGNRTLIIYVGDKREANVETTITQTFTMDFKNKIYGSLIENPNIAKYIKSTELLAPTNGTWGESYQETYAKLLELDNSLANSSVSDAGFIPQRLFSFNISEDFKRKFPSLFNGLNVTQQVALVKKYITKSYPSIYAKGSNGAGNKATLNLFSPTENKYVVAATNNTDTIKKIGINLSAYATSFYMDSNGILNMLVNAEPSDGKAPSSLSIDYVSLEYTVTIPFPPIN